jgi:hypothetical protein
MPIIYLKHPVHGTKVATMEVEAEADEKNGWIVYNPDTRIKTESKIVDEVKIEKVAPINGLESKRIRNN